MIKVFLSTLVLFVIGLIFFFSYAFAYNIKLYSHLKKNDYKRWRELTTIGNFGPGLSNPFRWLPYLYSDLDNENEDILKYKDSVRFGLRQSFFILMAIFVDIIVLVVLVRLRQ